MNVKMLLSFVAAAFAAGAGQSAEIEPFTSTRFCFAVMI